MEAGLLSVWLGRLVAIAIHKLCHLGCVDFVKFQDAPQEVMARGTSWLDQGKVISLACPV